MSPSLAVYPNPSDGRFTMKIVMPEGKAWKLFIVDVSGRSQIVGESVGEDEVLYDSHGRLANGVYFARLTFGNGKLTTKFVVIK